MMFLFMAFFLFSVPGNIHGDEVYSVETSYEELKNLNASCYPRDSCEAQRWDNTPDFYGDYSCSCNKFCSNIDTCCIDSPYKNDPSPATKPVCTSSGASGFVRGYYMIGSCHTDDGPDSMWKNLCEDEWNGEDDLMKLVPVTSLYTSTTYKNYYCFRCHETTDEFLFWDVKLQSNDYDFRTILQDRKVSLTYDTAKKTWMAVVEEEGLTVPVELAYSNQADLYPMLIRCEPSVISSCSDKWSDRITRDKCDAYMAIIHVKGSDDDYKAYKNPHCALCNFETLDETLCEILRDLTAGVGDKKFFSFTHFLDINRSNGDLVGKLTKCGENYLWDPYANKCRKISCALPGYVFKNGKCSPP